MGEIDRVPAVGKVGIHRADVSFDNAGNSGFVLLRIDQGAVYLQVHGLVVYDLGKSREDGVCTMGDIRIGRTIRLRISGLVLEGSRPVKGEGEAGRYIDRLLRLESGKVILSVCRKKQGDIGDRRIRSHAYRSE